MGYKPRIQRGGSSLDLPLPLRKISERHVRKIKSVQVPLQAGVLVANSLRGAMLVSFAGIIKVNNSQDDTPWTSIIDAKHDLEMWLLENDEAFIFYRFIDGETINGVELGPANAGTRWYKNCFCSSLNFEFTSSTVYTLPYTFTILVPDGIEYYEEP